MNTEHENISILMFGREFKEVLLYFFFTGEDNYRSINFFNIPSIRSELIL